MKNKVVEEFRVPAIGGAKKRDIRRILLFRIPSINYHKFDNSRKYTTQQPIGIAILAACLRKEIPSIEVRLVDLELETLRMLNEDPDVDNVLEKCAKKALDQTNPDLVGLSVVFSPSVENGFQVAEIVKNFSPEIPIVFGGVHCTFDYRNILENSYADAVFLKEADDNFVNYVNLFSFVVARFLCHEFA